MALKSITSNFRRMLLILSLVWLGCKAVVGQSPDIAISQELIETAEFHKVKSITVWGNKAPVMRFGKYRIQSAGRVKSKTDTSKNAADSTTHNFTEKEYSFEVTDRQTDTLSVSVYQDLTEKELRFSEWKWHLSGNLADISETELYINREENRELLSRSRFIYGLFRNGELDENLWTFLMEDSEDPSSNLQNGAVLTNGARIIRIMPTFSEEFEKQDETGFEAFKADAFGYEFIENGTSLAAIQLSGSGIWGTGKRYIWLRGDLEPELEITLAGAIMLLFQLGFVG